jgi:hypothetical protein
MQTTGTSEIEEMTPHLAGLAANQPTWRPCRDNIFPFPSTAAGGFALVFFFFFFFGGESSGAPLLAALESMGWALLAGRRRKCTPPFIIHSASCQASNWRCGRLSRSLWPLFCQIGPQKNSYREWRHNLSPTAKHSIAVSIRSSANHLTATPPQQPPSKFRRSPSILIILGGCRFIEPISLLSSPRPLRPLSLSLPFPAGRDGILCLPHCLRFLPLFCQHFFIA